MSKLVVLDSSAILAVIRKEKGHEVVISRLGSAMVSTVNLCEVLYKSTAKEADFEMTRWILGQMPVRSIEFDMEQAAIAAKIDSVTEGRSVSLADKACLALGIAKNVPVLTSDKVWADLGVEAEVELFR